MVTAIQMPQPGNTVEECILVNWLAQPGDAVAEGDIIAEIETDKANFEVEAPAGGKLLATFFDAGDLVPVLTNIGAIGDEGEDYGHLRPQTPTAETAPPAPAAAPSPEPAAAPPPDIPVRTQTASPTPPPAPVAPVKAPSLSPRARRFARQHDFDPGPIHGSGPNGRILEADARESYEKSPRVSPLAREMLKAGHRPRRAGSGINHSLRAADLSAPPVRLQGIRQTIAKRMRESLATTAQYTMHASAEATALLAARASLKAEGGEESAVNINDLVMYVTVRTLLEVPALNTELIGGEVFTRQEIDLAFACDTPRGLVVPVVRDAGSLPLTELAARIHLLAEQAANGTLSPDDMTGGTFTVSNLGSLGIEAFTPIVNPPQVAILGVNAIQLKPVRRNGSVEFVDRIGFSLTCDHQVIDGAPGARFLQRLTANIENVRHLAGMADQEN